MYAKASAGFWNSGASPRIWSRGPWPMSVTAPWTMFARTANDRHTPNCTSTPRCFPSSTAGMNDDNRNIHAKEWMNTIRSILAAIHSPTTGRTECIDVVSVSTVVWVKSW